MIGRVAASQGGDGMQMGTEKKVNVAYVRPGMFISRLDRPWLGLPFPLEGFLLQDARELDLLRKYCDVVYVDPARSTIRLPRPEELEKAPEQRLRVTNYVNTRSHDEEFPHARLAFDQASALTEALIADIRAGKKLHLDNVIAAVEPVVKSVLRNADTFLWISRLRKLHNYDYNHALNCSLLATLFGRHMGFHEEVLINLAMGGLLLDVGKSEVPESILLHPGPLNDAERIQVRRHVGLGLRAIEAAGIREPVVLAMVGGHHERHDGSGYPFGLVRNQIPLFARIGAVVDTYDALTSARPYRPALAAHQALQSIYRFRDKHFQSELIEQLMQCLSVYPTGSLVELNSGEVAIVLAQNQARRLRPQVMVLTTADKQRLEQFYVIDLLNQAGTSGSDAPMEIASTLEPGAFGIDPHEIYLAQAA